MHVLFNRPADSVTCMYCDLKSVNVNMFADLSNANWDTCWFYKTVDQKLDYNVPVRPLRAINSSCPWYNYKVRMALKTRNKLYAKWRRTNTDHAWWQYKHVRNISIIRNAKRLYFKYKLDPLLPSKDLRRNLKHLNVHGKLKSDCEINPEILRLLY